MFSSITAGAVRGIDSYLIQVETDISDGLPIFSMVGYVGAEVREAGERVRVALRNYGVRLPPKRITVNLAPADIPKRGIVLDLPVCVGILSCMGILPEGAADGVLITGELSLDGEIRPVRGVMSAAAEACRQGLHTCIVPEANAAEGAALGGIRTVGVSDLSELVRYLCTPLEQRDSLIPPVRVDVEKLLREHSARKTADFASVHGQMEAKRILEIAAAGRHNVLLTGPPGTGKSMLASCLPGIMPRLTVPECLEISEIYSVAGKLPEDTSLILERPFVAPHHNSTRAALLGGGRIPVPGMLSLSHLGVLFLDEFPELGREQLELLREPLEDHEVRIARQGGTFRFPARVLMVAAQNPCPCGFYPDRNLCRCSPWQIARYHNRISGPLLDRIDLQAYVGRVDISQLMEPAGPGTETSADIQKRVEMAAARQRERLSGTGCYANGDMDGELTEKYCLPDKEGTAFMRVLYDRLSLSARGYHRILRTARTIADLDESETIGVQHLREAAQCRLRNIGADMTGTMTGKMTGKEERKRIRKRAHF
ncbi:MAG: YifB family Mg chelatase-like AAA ATPase [Lachnospiraceae bacterium]|nr:YifB family Mg chelatase-like AAA ATPase [Lachnospiraceae bacterium]